jgi:hypothetical protein
MAAHYCRKAISFVPIVIILTIVSISATGCSEEAVANRSLKKVIHAEIKQFNRYHQREVKRNVYQSNGRFYRTFKERIDATTSMRRTNAVETPYIATIKFTENTYVTQRRAASVESQRDSHFSLSSSRKGELVYTYVGGLWRKKEVY